jgi:hypothetical protein
MGKGTWKRKEPRLAARRVFRGRICKIGAALAAVVALNQEDYEVRDKAGRIFLAWAKLREI